MFTTSLKIQEHISKNYEATFYDKALHYRKWNLLAKRQNFQNYDSFDYPSC